MAGPDLVGAQQAIQNLMSDDCLITRDAQGSGDDTYDTATLTYTPPNPDATSVYTGPCLITARPLQPQQGVEGGRPVVSYAYEASIPVGAPEPAWGDVLVVTASRWDDTLVGRRFFVRQVTHESFVLSLDFALEESTTVPVGQP